MYRMLKIFAFASACAMISYAQDFRATITGHVADATGAAVPRVSVQILNVATNEVAAAVSDAQGVYTAPFLQPGTYRITVEAAGFKKLIQNNVVLNVGQTAGIDLKLEVGQTSDSVTISADSAVLDTESSDRGLVIDEKRVTELPLNARNPFMLAILSAGVNFNGNPIYQRPFDNGAIADWSVNGGLDRKNEFLLDGAPNNAQAGGNNIAYVPPVDSVREFKIQTNSYDAQYGKTSGGILSVSLKSGTNQVHGTGYEFARRNSFDANSFQNNAQGTPKAGHFLDQYGGSIGGPLYLPKVYDGRNKSFFFFNWEQYSEGTPTPLNLSVPQPEFLTGDFSKLTDAAGNKITIYDPATGVVDASGNFVRQPFPNNMIPQNRLNPIALKILGYQPKPNITVPGSAYSINNFFLPGGKNLDSDEFYNFVVKADQNIGERNHVYFRFASNDRTELRTTNGLTGVAEDGPRPLKRLNDTGVADWVSTLTPSLIFNVRVSLSRYVEGSRGDGNVGFDTSQLGFATSLTDQYPVKGLFGRYEFSGYNSLGRFASFNFTNTFAVHPNITKIAGPHAIKAGVDMRWIQYNDQNQGNPFRLTVDQSFTQKVYNNADSSSGNSLASFLLGNLNGGGIDYNQFYSYLGRYFAPYVQDDWKVSRKLTLNLGLRWDFNVPPKERYNRLNNGFDPNVVSPIDARIDRSAFPNFQPLKGGLLFVKPGAIDSHIDYTGIQPRFGFAYQAFNKFVVRGGIGRYDINPSNDWFRTSGYSITTGVVSSLDSGRTAIPNLLGNPFPTGVQQPPRSSLGAGTFVGRGIDFFNPTFKLPYVDQFSLGFQYQLPLSSRLGISYVGNRTYKLQTARQYNEPDISFRRQCNPLEGGSPAYCDQLVPNPFYNLPEFAGTSRGTSPTISRFELNRPFPQFGALNERGRNDGKLWYNGLQVDYGVRAQKGLNFTFAYTYSRAIERGGFDSTNSSNGNSNGLNGNNANQAFNDPQRFVYEQGPTSYDRPHVFKISAVYELPFGKGKPFLNTSNPILSRVVGGWEYTTIFQYSSGRPWSLPDNVAYVRDATIKNVDFSVPVVQAVRPCVAKEADDGSITLQSFSRAVPGCTLDNYNFLVLPRYAPRQTPFRTSEVRLDAKPQFDMSLAKNTQIYKERISGQFRVEAFNVFNTFWMPLQQFNNDPNSANFGQIIKATVAQGNANFPRQIQLGFKLIF